MFELVAYATFMRENSTDPNYNSARIEANKNEFEIHPIYLAALREVYKSEVNPTDFNNAAAAVKTINE